MKDNQLLIEGNLSQYERNSSVSALIACLGICTLDSPILQDLAEHVAQRIIYHAQFAIDHLFGGAQ